MEDKIILNTTELTGILGKNEIKNLSKVFEKEKWDEYRRKFYESSFRTKFIKFPYTARF